MSNPIEKAFRDAINEFERLRRLVPDGIDYHLNNWGAWRRTGKLTEGYSDHVPGLAGSSGRCVAEDASDHDYEHQMMYAAEVADAVIAGLEQPHRLAISNVYEASVWRFRRVTVQENDLIDGAAAFWKEASRRGLA